MKNLKSFFKLKKIIRKIHAIKYQTINMVGGTFNAKYERNFVIISFTEILKWKLKTFFLHAKKEEWETKFKFPDLIICILCTLKNYIEAIFAKHQKYKLVKDSQYVDQNLIRYKMIEGFLI